MISSKDRAFLRSIANKLECVFQIGKNGVTPELTKSIDEYLEAKEIIKINVLNNCQDNIKNIAITLSERTRSNIVSITGKKIILYRTSKNQQKIIFPR